MKTILEVKNLCKSFEDTQVLNDINFKVDEGEFLAIMGQSGCGKSTLLYGISGMDRPTSGMVLFCGKDISKLDDEKISKIRLKQMGFIFQRSYLLKNLSIRDNIVLPGFKAKALSREQVNQKANALMAKTGISNVAKHDIKRFRVDNCNARLSAGHLLISRIYYLGMNLRERSTAVPQKKSWISSITSMQKAQLLLLLPMMRKWQPGQTK